MDGKTYALGAHPSLPPLSFIVIPRDKMNLLLQVFERRA